MTDTTRTSRLATLLRFLRAGDGSVAQKTVRSGAWVGLSHALTGVLRFVASMILARLLVPEHFGLIGIALFVIRGLDVLSQPGLSAAIIHRRDRIAEATDAAWSVLILRGIILAVLSFAAAPLVAGFYGEPALLDILRVVALSFIIQGFVNSHLILLRRELDFRKLASLEITVSLLHFVVVVGLAWWLRSVWALVWGRIVLESLRLAMSYVVTDRRPRFSLPGQLIRELFRYGKFVTGATIVVFMTGTLDNAVMGKVQGMRALGYYTLAYSLATLMSTYASPVITRVLFPAFRKLQDDPVSLQQAYFHVLKLVTMLALPIATGMAVLAPQVVGVAYGPEWLPMVAALRILSIFGALQAMAVTTQPVFLAVGRPDLDFYASLGRLLLLGALLYPLTVWYGITGTACAVAIPAAVHQLALWLLFTRTVRSSLSRILRTVFPSVFATALMALAVFFLQSRLPTSGLLPLLACVGTGVFSYFGALLAIDRKLVRDYRTNLNRIFGRSTR